MMGYDRAIVTFSPDGRLFQIEYAREAVKRGTTSLGIIFSDGVVLVGTRPLTELSVPNAGGEKVFEIDENLGAAISGFLADGRVLVDRGRIKAQVFRLTYDETLDVLGVVKEISDLMQLYSQYGGVRPFGVAFLLGGVDEKGPQLFEIDPSSTFYGWKAHAIGRGAPEALKLLRKEWKEGLSEEDAIKLALKALKAGEKGLKMSEIELAVINGKGFTKFYGDEGLKFIKKFW
jgi:proteasome alpha subunit